jgi:hypothetical protein
MTDKTRIKIAAAVTALFLGGISAAGLAARDDQPQAAATTAAQPSTTLDQSAPVGGRAGHEADKAPYEEHEDDE